jgi:hypothetical protein
MSTPASRSYVRHAGDDPDFYRRLDDEKAERQAEIAARLAAFEAKHGPLRPIRKDRR